MNILPRVWISYVVTVLLIVSNYGCSTGKDFAFVSPKGHISIHHMLQSDKQVPFLVLGEVPDFPYEIMGHIQINSGETSKSLNLESDLSKWQRNRINNIALQIGADAVVSVTGSNYRGWTTAGFFVNGIAVRTQGLGFHSKTRPDFIVCLLPLKAAEDSEEALEFDRDVRLSAATRLKNKGYYVLLPEYSEIDTTKVFFDQMSDEDLSGLCNHETDLFVVLNFTEENSSFASSVYSKKERRFVMQSSGKSGKVNPASKITPFGGFAPAIITGIFSASINADKLTEEALAAFPDIRQEI